MDYMELYCLDCFVPRKDAKREWGRTLVIVIALLLRCIASATESVVYVLPLRVCVASRQLQDVLRPFCRFAFCVASRHCEEGRRSKPWDRTKT